MSTSRKTKVIFLGAGASAPFGFPLTKGILPWVLKSISNNTLFGNESLRRTELKELINVIMPGLEQWQAGTSSSGESEGLPLITDVLSLIDHLALNSNAASASLSSAKLTMLRKLLERAIFEALVRDYSVNALDLPAQFQENQGIAQERGFTFEGDSQAPTLLTTLGDWIQSEFESGKVTIISTNYDIAAETELFKRIQFENIWSSVDFGFDVRDPITGRIVPRPDNPLFAVYKLHGSLNWLRCDLCDHVYVNPAGAIAYLAFLENAGDAGLCHCGFAPLRHVMVAPSIVRDVRDPNLLQVWRNSLEAMRVADEWIIIGYSMPPEDIAIRSLFLRALNSRRGLTKPAITVVQLRDDTKAQYKLLFPNCDYQIGGIEAFLANQ
jgi:hypothetical protein